ncbi:hypothetical protein LV779_08970 [Streptomyces thinghirensis]|nr:hypothetical protein [Streptomyces thinghirensis]
MAAIGGDPWRGGSLLAVYALGSVARADVRVGGVVGPVRPGPATLAAVADRYDWAGCGCTPRHLARRGDVHRPGYGVPALRRDVGAAVADGRGHRIHLGSSACPPRGRRPRPCPTGRARPRGRGALAVLVRGARERGR